MRALREIAHPYLICAEKRLTQNSVDAEGTQVNKEREHMEKLGMLH